MLIVSFCFFLLKLICYAKLIKYSRRVTKLPFCIFVSINNPVYQILKREIPEFRGV